MTQESPTIPNETAPRAVLLGLAAVFVLFGVAFLLAPAKMASLVDLTANSKTALVELRAFYGGIELGLGAFFAIAATRRDWMFPALMAALFSLLGVAAARIYGISVEGGQGVTTFLLLLVEVAGVFGAGWAAVRARRLRDSDTLDADLAALQKESDKAELGAGKTVPIEKTKPIIERTVRLENAKSK